MRNYPCIWNTSLRSYQKQATRGVIYKKVFLKISQNSQENNCARIKKKNLAQVFSGEFCKIFKNIFFRGSEFSSCETELRKMTSHFELLMRRFL